MDYLKTLDDEYVILSYSYLPTKEEIRFPNMREIFRRYQRETYNTSSYQKYEDANSIRIHYEYRTRVCPALNADKFFTDSILANAINIDEKYKDKNKKSFFCFISDKEFEILCRVLIYSSHSRHEEFLKLLKENNFINFYFCTWDTTFLKHRNHANFIKCCAPENDAPIEYLISTYNE